MIYRRSLIRADIQWKTSNFPLVIWKPFYHFYLLSKHPLLKLVIFIRVIRHRVLFSPCAAPHCSVATSVNLQDSVHAVLKHCGEVGPRVLEQDATQGWVRRVGRVFHIPDFKHAATRPQICILVMWVVHNGMKCRQLDTCHCRHGTCENSIWSGIVSDPVNKFFLRQIIKFSYYAPLIMEVCTTL